MHDGVLGAADHSQAPFESSVTPGLDFDTLQPLAVMEASPRNEVVWMLT
jgi:hypothetical protein